MDRRKRPHIQLHTRIFPLVFAVPVFLVLTLFCSGCGLFTASGSGPEPYDRTIQVVIEESPQFTTETLILSADAGSDLSFLLTPADHCTVRGTDYRDYSLEEAGNGQFLCTLRDVRYDTAVSILTEENPYTIRYDANGGTPISRQTQSEFSYSTRHLRVNTSQGTELFARDGYTLTGWNTASDGSGRHISLGSRVKVAKNEPLTLYAEWALWNSLEDFLYEADGNAVTITGMNTAPGPVITIPASIDGLPVTRIASSAFKDAVCDRVILPPTVRTVDVHAFDNCTLKELILFDSVSEITDYAFEGCENLQRIRINACVPPVYSGSYYDTFADKCDRLAELKDSAKIVLFSGSSTRFGYDSSYLDDAFTGYEVVNMGVFAYTNALPQLDLIRQNMRAGDILIHSPEFDAAKRQFCTTNAFDDKFFNMIEADYDLLAELDYRDYEGVLSAFTTFQKTRGGMEAKSYSVSAADYDEDGQPVSSPSYNEYGDYIVYRPGSTDDAPIYDLPVSYTVGAFPRAAYIDPLNAVYDSFTAGGIRVLFTYAPRNKSALSAESDDAALAELDAFFREVLHAEVISDIGDSLYPGRYLYGTDNHLSTDGVKIRTERIRRDLEEVLKDAK